MKHRVDFGQIKNAKLIDHSYLKFLYFSRHGRINRSRFYWGYLLATVPYALVAAFLAETSTEIAGPILIQLFCLCLWMNIMLCIKRAHDVNRSGKFCWLFLVPPLSFWVLIELGLFEGTSGDNRFGPDMTT